MKAGFLYNFNDRVALDVNMGYNPNISGGSGQSRVSGGVGLKVFLGTSKPCSSKTSHCTCGGA